MSVLAAPGAYEVPVLPPCFLPPLPSKPTAAPDPHFRGCTESGRVNKQVQPRGYAGLNSGGQIGLL